jgi:hypothetical protein
MAKSAAKKVPSRKTMVITAMVCIEELSAFAASASSVELRDNTMP